nr:hypothetical protein [Actinomadura rubrisoli]
MRGEQPRPGEHLLKGVRQLIESVNHTLKGQLDPERHGGRTIEGGDVVGVGAQFAPGGQYLLLGLGRGS